MRTLLILLILVAVSSCQPTYAAEWHGPGAAPCDGRCSVEWALGEIQGHVPPVVLSQWHSMRIAGWPMQPMFVRDGDSIIAMGEYIGHAHMITTPMRARLTHWEASRGWLVMHDGDAYLFMIVRDCQNPAVIVRRDIEQLPVSVPEATFLPVQPLPDFDDWQPQLQPPVGYYSPPRAVDVPAPMGVATFALLALLIIGIWRNRR